MDVFLFLHCECPPLSKAIVVAFIECRYEGLWHLKSMSIFLVTNGMSKKKFACFRGDITLFNDVDPHNTTVECWEFI